jgi:hypothetical protein
MNGQGRHREGRIGTNMSILQRLTSAPPAGALPIWSMGVSRSWRGNGRRCGVICIGIGISWSSLVPLVLDLAVNLRIDGSATTEMHRDRETKCREEVRGEAQR